MGVARRNRYVNSGCLGRADAGAAAVWLAANSRKFAVMGLQFPSRRTVAPRRLCRTAYSAHMYVPAAVRK